jgi:hypothetical protein
MFITAKEALRQGVIRKHWQPMYRRYAYSADGCGDNLYSTSSLAVSAYQKWRTLHIVLTEAQIVGEPNIA